MRTYLLTMALLVAVASLGNAQNNSLSKEEREEQARLTAAVLVGNGLIVYLPTNTRKIAAMQELIDTGDLTATNRNRLKERLTTTLQETKEEAVLIQATFAEFYDVGPVYFIPDTALVKLKRGQRSGYFYNEQLEIDPNIVAPEDFVLVRPGYLDPAVTTGAEGLVLTDSDMEPLVKPFSSAIAFNNMAYFFNGILAKEIANRKRWKSAVKILNRRFWQALDILED